MGRLRVSAKLAAVTLTVLAVIAASTAVAWIAVEDSSAQLSAGPDIGAVTTALTVVRQVNSLADTATVRTHAGMTPETLAESRASMDAEVKTLHKQLDDLAVAGYGQASDTIRELLAELVRRVAEVDDNRPLLARVLGDSERRRQELIAATNWDLLPAAVASEDNMFYRLITERSGAVAPEDLLDYARLALLTQQADQGSVLLEVAARQSDAAFVATVEENLNLVMYQLSDSIEVFRGDDNQDLEPTLIALLDDLVDAAYGDANLIDMMKTRLDLAVQEARNIAAINEVLTSLQTEVTTLLSQTIGSIGATDEYRGTADVLEAALAVDRHLSAVAATSISRTTPTTPPGDLSATRDATAVEFSGIRQHLDVLEDAGHGDAVLAMRASVDRIQADIDEIHDGRPALAEALQSAASQRAQLRAFFNYQLRPAVVASLDNQLYYMLTGRSDLGGDPAGDSDRLSRGELLQYRHLTLAFSSLFRTFSGLIIAIIISEPTLIAEAEERFTTAAHRLERSITFLEHEGGDEIHPELVPLARQFIAFGNGDGNVFDSLRHRLDLVVEEAGLIDSSREASIELQSDVNELLDRILEDASASALDPDGNDSNSQTIVLLLGVVAAIVTLLAAAAVARRANVEPL